jgi:2',3'-cyclic-nucleotide 2'-phosphodiesterase (5'-nucleotidase family)
MALVMRDRFLAIVAAWVLMIFCCTLLYAALEEPISIMLTADTEGRIELCQDCPREARLGGLARRGATRNKLRQEDSVLLLLDVGNTFLGMTALKASHSGAAAERTVSDCLG